MTVSSKPARTVSFISLILCLLFFIGTLLLGRWTQFFAITAASWLSLGAALIWLVLTIHFQQIVLAQQEKLDMDQVSRDSRDTAIFEQNQEQQTLFAVAQKRLDTFEKWFLPIFSGLIALYHVLIGLYLLREVINGFAIEPGQSLIGAVAMMAVAFISFLMSRYATGMSASKEVPQWKPLRAGGSILLALALLCFAMAIGLALAQFKKYIILDALNWVIPSLLIILGAETALNIIFDIYRPRIKGQYNRSAFDSRLLGVINEPGGVFHTAASAIDYQFGFKVSQTWFYKLLEKAVIPLLLFAIFTLYLMSVIVIVDPDEQAIIEHLGNPVTEAGEVRIKEPGISFKWPWPIDIAYTYPVRKINEIQIGYVPEIDPETGMMKRELLLWGKSHYKEEFPILVASEAQTAGDTAGAVPVSLINANIPVQYRVKDLYAFLYHHHNPEEVLQTLCYQELTRYAACSTIEVEGDDIEKSLLGAGREKAKQILTECFQQAADARQLGVEIVFVGVQGIHPTPEVAADYQKVIGAVQSKQAIIFDALAQRNRALTSLAGSVEQAGDLYELARAYQQVRRSGDQDRLGSLGTKLDGAFAEARGEIFTTLRQAQSYAYERAILAQATGKRFADQVKAYHAAKAIYRQHVRLNTLEEGLSDARKYVVTADANDSEVFIVDMQEKLTPSLYDIGAIQENPQK